jgi:aminoglycoside/choline kinase family phosphotransferase
MTGTVFPFAHVSQSLRDFLTGQGVVTADLPLAGLAGSQRAYYRVPGSGFILLVSPATDLDFGRFLRITQFYRMLGVPVPKVYCIDDEAHQVLLEDLGERRLYDLLLADRSAGLAAYRRSLDLLADLQTRCDAFRPECPDIDSRVFDRKHLLWETSYFRENYLEGFRSLKTDPELQTVFDALAARVDSHPKAILHRDFQSQNLMVKPDASVHVIDYQGSRYGSVFYDAASLLLDPYVMLSDIEIENLLEHFRVRVSVQADPAAFRAAFLEAGLQRVMQALGAYCFLSQVKGITAFAEHIPAGEARLRWLIRQAGTEWAAVLPD